MENSDIVNKLPTDNSPVPKSHLEMLDMLMTDKTKMNSIMSKLKTPLFAAFMYFIFSSEFGSSLLKKLTGGSQNLNIYATLIFFAIILLFELRSKA